MSNGKIIVLDFSVFMFTAIFGHKYTPTIPLTYTVTNCLLAAILKIGVEPEDDIIVVLDKGKSWRKMYEPGYKEDRKGKREKYSEINWEESFKQVNNLVLQLEYATNWTFLGADSLEADDWASYIPRYYKDRECVLISFDSDWEQMLILPNVKLFSPKSKKYKFNKNPYASLSKKINKETADNLINPILNEEDFNKREICVNLFTLPDFVEDIIKTKLDTLTFDKQEHIDDFPFTSLRAKYANLYNDKSKIVYIDKCLKQLERKANKKKKAKKCLKSEPKLL